MSIDVDELFSFLELLDFRHHQHGRWQARIGRVAGNKDLYLGTFSKLLISLIIFYALTSYIHANMSHLCNQKKKNEPPHIFWHYNQIKDGEIYLNIYGT